MNVAYGATSLVVLLTIATVQSSHAQWWRSFEPARSAASKPGFDYTYETYGQAVDEVGMAFRTRDFQKLDRMYDEFLRDELRATDGTWMVQAFGFAMDGGFRALDDAAIEKLFADWKEKSPQSRLRPVAYALMWQATAWKARGTDRASEVKPEMWTEFRRRLELAEKALADSAGVGAASPLWHGVNLGVAGSAGAPAAELDRRFEAGVTRFPSYQILYYARMNFLLPQWGGDYDQVDAFIADAERRTARTDGKAFYAWLYADVAKKRCCDDIFAETRVSWPKMREAFEDMLARFPDFKNVLLYTTYACLARDGPTTARLMALVKPRMIDLQMATNRVVTNERCNRVAASGTSPR